MSDENESAKRVIRSYLKRLRGERRPGPAWFHFSWDIFPAFLLAATSLLILAFIQFYGFQNHGVQLLSTIPAFGATSVLLYGSTQLNASQPRAVLVSQFVSALIAICIGHIFRRFGEQPFTLQAGASVAVALSLVFMKATSTIHPPACATAVIATLYTINTEVRDEGFLFLVTPVLLGCAVLLMTAWLGNNLFPSRKAYPTVW